MLANIPSIKIAFLKNLNYNINVEPAKNVKYTIYKLNYMYNPHLLEIFVEFNIDNRAGKTWNRTQKKALIDFWMDDCAIWHILNNTQQSTFEFLAIGNFKNNFMTWGFILPGMIHYMASW